jgi:hypothetical protein
VAWASRVVDAEQEYCDGDEVEVELGLCSGGGGNGDGMEGSAGVRQFSAAGMVMMYATNLTYSREVDGQSRGEASAGQANVGLVTVVDPRLRVIRRAPVVIVDATDNGGRVLMSQAPPTTPALQGVAANVWEQAIVLPVGQVEAGRRVNLRCLVQGDK